MAAVGVYVLAMVLHAVEYAGARAARTPVAAPVAVAVGAGATDAGGDPPAGATAAGRDVPARSRAERLGGAAVNLVVLAAVLQLGSIVARGLATDRWPLGNMYEFTS